jgi:hypothetical protein
MSTAAADKAHRRGAMSRRRRLEFKRRRRHDPAEALDRLVPDVGTKGAPVPGLRRPPALVVQGPEDAARRRARDERDGVAVSDPKRRLVYVVIAVFVAILVFAVLGLIETRELPGALPR